MRVVAAVAAPLAPGLEAFRMAEPPLRDDELGAVVLAAFEELFWGALAAPRVLASFRRLQVSTGSAQEVSKKFWN